MVRAWRAKHAKTARGPAYSACMKHGLERWLVGILAGLTTLAARAQPVVAEPPSAAPNPAVAPPLPTSDPKPAPAADEDEDEAEAEEHPPATVKARRVEAESGRDLANFPPHVLFDYLHVRVALDIADMESQTFRAEESLAVRAIGQSRDRLTLDAGAGISVESIYVDGLPATFTHEHERLEIALPTPSQPAPAAPVTVSIRYTAKNTSREGNGLSWFKTRPSRRERGAQIYTQGQAFGNHLWLPIHDFPNERLTSEVIVSVDSAYRVISNGRLLEKAELGDGRTRWHWMQDKPHVSYLIMLAIGKFDEVDLNPPAADGAPRAGPASRPDLPMPVYGPVGSREALARVFARTPAMMQFLETKFDEPYPWDQYAQVLVRNYRWGGMENTSATVLGEFSARGGDQDDLIVHELGHQWMGDLVTCRSWEHLWLNEGWATYLEAVWAGELHGTSGYRDTLARTAASMLEHYRERPGQAPRDVPMVSNRYSSPDDPFQKGDDVYAKGGFILHMLHERLGDEVFWKGVRLYIDRHKFGLVETDDFRRVMEEVSGESLQRFFTQWCMRAGVPDLAVSVNWLQDKSEASVIVTQRQPINGDNPAYALRVPVLLTLESGEKRWVIVDTQTRAAGEQVALPSPIKSVSVDPEMSVLGRLQVESDFPSEVWGGRQNGE